MADSSFLERTVGLAPEVDESPAESAGRFADVDENGPHGAAIAWLADRGITRGCDQGRFCPDRPVTRGQMAAFLHRFVPDVERTSVAQFFVDVDGASPFAADIEWLVSTGITRGCAEGAFCPDLVVTRGQMAAFLYRIFGNGAVVDGAAFTDVPATSPFSTEISWLASTGVSNGSAFFVSTI